MFTVKHIQDNGSESLFAARDVHYDPLGAGDSDGHAGHVSVDLTDGGDWHIYAGTVFVMNAVGKTVQRYDLSALVPKAQTVQQAIPVPGIAIAAQSPRQDFAGNR